MPKFLKNLFVYEHNWRDVTLAHWLKYPNPFAAHVIAGDVIERRILQAAQDQSNANEQGSLNNNNNNNNGGGLLYTVRLFLKTGSVPKWGQTILRQGSKAFIVEESLIDPQSQTMTTRTRNLSHMSMMQVIETIIYRPHPQNPSWTLAESEVTVKSGLGWGLSSRIESFGVKRFADNMQRSRQGMLHVLRDLNRRLRPFAPATK